MFCCSFLCLGNASWCTVFVQVSCEATPWGWIFVVVLKENHHSGCVLVNVHVVWPDVDVRINGCIYIHINGVKWVYINGYYWHLLTIGSLLESGLLTICLDQWFLILVSHWNISLWADGLPLPDAPGMVLRPRTPGLPKFEKLQLHCWSEDMEKRLVRA